MYISENPICCPIIIAENIKTIEIKKVRTPFPSIFSVVFNTSTGIYFLAKIYATTPIGTFIKNI